ncbi:MAG TPA: hypothetical protein VFS97_01825 [Nitrososphaeraceae archaeon]|nr:hypothetical protein [Nitrososphaeraceae archaeon]
MAKASSEADRGDGSIIIIMIMLIPYLTRSALHTTKKSTGFCITRGKITITEAFFKLEGATIVRRYCDRCLSSAYY